MNSEQLHLISKDISYETTKWIERFPTGGKFDSLKSSFDPLLKGLLGECDWVVTGVKTGATKLFIPELNSEHDDKKFLSILIQSFANTNKALSTIELCLALTSSRKGLAIITKSDWYKGDCLHFHYIDVEELVNKINNNTAIFITLINESLKDKIKPTPTELEILSNKLFKILISFPRANIFPNHPFDEKTANLITSVQFSLYILLITLINNSWAKVIMLPTYTTANHLHQPGGIVLCLKTVDAIDNISLDLIKSIGSIPFLPWMLTARTTNRSNVQHLKPKIIDYKPGISNNYRNIEYLMGGDRYTLSNKRFFKYLTKLQEYITPIIGLKRCCELINIMKPDSVVYVEKDSNGNKNVISTSIDINEIEQILIEHQQRLTGSLTSLFQSNSDALTNYEDFILWHSERKQRIANIEESVSAKVCNSISIIVPIASNEERFANFYEVLNSYNQQTLIVEHPELVELIILIDSNAGDDNFRILKLSQLKEHIETNLINLKGIHIKYIYSKKTNGSVGRSSIRNHGISLAKGTIIQLFDDSILLHKYYLEEILIRFEHLRGQKFALVGFKERVTADQSFISSLSSLMNEKEVIIPNSNDDFKCYERFHLPIKYLNKDIPADSVINYMNLTNDLCFMTGNCEIGYRALNHFFSTSNVAFWRQDFVDSGGFHPRFDKDWGMEDGFLGLLLTINGVKIIPCYSALAFDLPHKKDDTKKRMKKDGAVPFNSEVLNELNRNNISYYNKELFFSNVENRKKFFATINLDVL